MCHSQKTLRHPFCENFERKEPGRALLVILAVELASGEFRALGFHERRRANTVVAIAPRVSRKRTGEVSPKKKRDRKLDIRHETSFNIFLTFAKKDSTVSNILF